MISSGSDLANCSVAHFSEHDKKKSCTCRLYISCVVTLNLLNF